MGCLRLCWLIYGVRQLPTAAPPVYWCRALPTSLRGAGVTVQCVRSATVGIHSCSCEDHPRTALQPAQRRRSRQETSAACRSKCRLGEVLQPGEAEQVVRTACQEGRIEPGLATMEALARVNLHLEQLHSTGC